MRVSPVNRPPTPALDIVQPSPDPSEASAAICHSSSSAGTPHVALITSEAPLHGPRRQLFVQLVHVISACPRWARQ